MSMGCQVQGIIRETEKWVGENRSREMNRCMCNSAASRGRKDI
jgi:hypothetical protein